MTATNHKLTKRRNLTRWMEARLKRLSIWSPSSGGPSPRQQERAAQLAAALNLANP